jgi:secondary thiamine-phosphate synthase enzyme
VVAGVVLAASGFKPDAVGRTISRVAHLPRFPYNDKRVQRAENRQESVRMTKGLTAAAERAQAAGAVPAGALIVRGAAITVSTRDRIQLVDLTDRIAAFVRESGARDGIVSVSSLHTTCAVFINETQAALHVDIKACLEGLVAQNSAWRHNDPAHSDCDRMNADAHLRAMLLGHSLALQVSDGEIVLGQWQRVLAAELDGPRERTIRLQVIGAGAQE